MRNKYDVLESSRNHPSSICEKIIFRETSPSSDARVENGKLVMYLHSAVRGKKLDMIRANPRVFFEIDCDLVPFESELPCQYGLSYSSVMGKGIAHIVDDVEEKKKAMSILMKTQTNKDFTFEDRLVSVVAVIRIDVESYTAKHRPIPEKLR